MGIGWVFLNQICFKPIFQKSIKWESGPVLTDLPFNRIATKVPLWSSQYFIRIPFKVASKLFLYNSNNKNNTILNVRQVVVFHYGHITNIINCTLRSVRIHIEWFSIVVHSYDLRAWHKPYTYGRANLDIYLSRHVLVDRQADISHEYTVDDFSVVRAKFTFFWVKLANLTMSSTIFKYINKNYTKWIYIYENPHKVSNGSVCKFLINYNK